MLAEIITAAALTISPCKDLPQVPSQYDRLIRAAVHQYWSPSRWPNHCWLKSQLWAESLLDPTAVSHADAHGIGQFLPSTWAEQERLLGMSGDIYDAEMGIIFAAFYTERLANQFSFAGRTELCRLGMQAASYNAGLGNVLKAQRLADGALCWDTVSQKMVKVTGRHSKETIGYVARIKRWYKRFTE